MCGTLFRAHCLGSSYAFVSMAVDFPFIRAGNGDISTIYTFLLARTSAPAVIRFIPEFGCVVPVHSVLSISRSSTHPNLTAISVFFDIIPIIGSCVTIYGKRCVEAHFCTTHCWLAMLACAHSLDKAVARVGCQILASFPNCSCTFAISHIHTHFEYHFA